MSRTFSDWVSQVMGRRVEGPLPQTVRELAASRSAIDWSRLNVDLPELAEMHPDVELGRWGERALTAEVYVPSGAGPFGVLLFLHGGGWFAGSAANERKLAMQLAAEAGNIVVSLDYALAPEHPFPIALEDCVYAARWCASRIGEFGGDPRRITIGGASAGANLAAATVCVLYGDDPAAVDPRGALEVSVDFVGCLLLYGVFDLARWAAKPGAFAGRAQLYQAAYLGSDWQRHNRKPLASPIHAPNLGISPPTYLGCGGQDSMLDQSLALCSELSAAEVPTTLSVVPGADHAFLNVPDAVAGSTAERERITGWLARTKPVAAAATGSQPDGLSRKTQEGVNT